MMKRIAASLIVLAAASSSAYALDLAGEMYVVGSIGRVGVNQTEVQVDNNNIMRSQPVINGQTGYTASLQDLQSTQTTSRNGYKLQLGYEFTPNLAVEGGYIDLGKTEYAATYTTRAWGWGCAPCNIAGNATKTNKISGWNIAAVGTYPLNNSFSLFAKLGMIDAKVKQTVTGGTNSYYTPVGDQDETKWKSYYGIGATYYPNHDRNFGIRAEYERFSKIGDSSTTGSADVSLTTVGVTTKF